MIKRAFDIILSLLLTLLFLPIMLIIALLIVANDLGPVFFVQLRVGLHGENFKILKFRTMKVGSDKVGRYSTLENDERVTKIGKWLRKYSLDELPQLFNVFLGQMSLVGPRPNVPEQESLYKEIEWLERNKVRPGITGLAQATKRSSATAQERLELDIYYVRNVGFNLDMKVLAMTIKQVLLKGGN